MSDEELTPILLRLVTEIAVLRGQLAELDEFRRRIAYLDGHVCQLKAMVFPRSAERDQEMLRRVRAGDRVKAIADFYSVSPTVVYDVARKAGTSVKELRNDAAHTPAH